MQQTQTTYGALSGIFGIPHYFGLFPMVTIHTGGITLPEFSWKSFKLFHAIFVLILQLLNLVFEITKVAKYGLNFSDTVTTFFYVFGVLSSILLLHLATRWPAIMRQWTNVDSKMMSYGFPHNLKSRLNIITAVVLSAALVEHGFYIMFSATNSPKPDKVTSFWEKMNNYLESSGSHWFKILPYNSVIGFLYFLTNITITFVWNYIDTLIMIVALALAARFRQINTRIEQVIEEINSGDVVEVDCQQNGGSYTESVWTVIREDYNRLSLLTGAIDNEMAYIVVLSFANNLFLILVQLLHSLEPQEKTRVVDRLYYVYSFGFLILRTCAVAISASQIYVESRRPSWYLTTLLPSSCYNTDVERLLMQIRATGGCFLTGNGFFKIKTSLILGIAGAIVSYELIFIQFNVLS